MSPIPAINPNLSSIMPNMLTSESGLSNMMPNVDMLTPESQMSPTSGIQMPTELAQSASVQPADNSFSSMLGQFVSDVNSQQVTSAQTVSALQSGQNVPLHQVVIAMQEANVSFQLMVEVRNRLLDSYQEIMRMQV
jgi:flagellar hook-basal body complex protein FliE